MDSIPSNLLDQTTLADLEREVKDYALCNGKFVAIVSLFAISIRCVAGICMRTRDNKSEDVIEVAPVTVFPSAFPRSCFELATSVQVLVNELMHRVAFDYAFLENTLKTTIEVDDFTKDLFDVHTRILKDGTAQPHCFGLFRADYMSDRSEDEFRLRQIEVNAISSSFVGLAPRVTSMHRCMTSKYHSSEVANLHIPENRADEKFGSAFVRAFELYGNANAVILVVKEDRVVNVCDQRTLEFAISELRPDIKIIRRSFSQLLTRASLRDNQLLLVDGLEVALVYYRDGYDPRNYATRDVWELRYLIERSRAIKCPSINYHLAGKLICSSLMISLTILLVDR